MQNKNMTITVAYHFLAEAMIIFLFAVPFMNGEYHWIPYWSYLGMALGIAALYSIYNTYEKSLAWYITTTPALMVLFFVVGYPFVLSVAFPILLTYRYIFLRKDTMLKRELTYLNLTVPLTIFLLIWMKDPALVIYAFLLLVLLLVGNIYSHLYNLRKKERQHINKKMWLTLSSFVGILAVGLYLLFGFRDVFNKIWYVLMEIPGYLGGKLGMLVGFFIPEPKLPGDMDGQDLADSFGSDSLAQTYKELLPEQNESSVLEDYASLIYWGIGILILITIVILSIRFFRYRFKPVAASTYHESVEYSSLDTKEKSNQSFFAQIFKSPDNKVRKLIYQFERDAEKVNAGRYPYETLDNWIERLGFHIDLTAYKNIRYGDRKDVKEDDVELLKGQLERMRGKLKGRE